MPIQTEPFTFRFDERYADKIENHGLHIDDIFYASPAPKGIGSKCVGCEFELNRFLCSVSANCADKTIFEGEYIIWIKLDPKNPPDFFHLSEDTQNA